MYKEIWDSELDEELCVAKRERNNVHDPFMIFVLKSGIIVGMYLYLELMA